MKKIILILAVIMLLFPFVGCDAEQQLLRAINHTMYTQTKVLILVPKGKHYCVR